MNLVLCKWWISGGGGERGWPREGIQSVIECRLDVEIIVSRLYKNRSHRCKIECDNIDYLQRINKNLIQNIKQKFNTQYVYEC